MISAALILSAPAQARDKGVTPVGEVGIDQKLDAQIPLDLTFRDESGKTVRLGDYFGKKPVVLNLIFYKCPGSCLMELYGMVQVFQNLKETAGKEFEVVTVSINPKETPEFAAAKKEIFLKTYNRPAARKGWHFLTGEQENIQALAKTVGFRYTFNLENEQFAHAAGLMVATPQGKISHYLYGTDYVPRDLRFSLIEASSGKIGPLTEKVLLVTCFQYDPMTGKYGFAIRKALQTSGIATVLIVAFSVLMMLRGERRRAAAESLAVASADRDRMDVE